MSSRRFKFGPQPALDQAIEAQKQCEQALARARRAVEEEKQKLVLIQAKIAEIKQQIHRAHDNLVSRNGQVSDPRELGQNGRFLDALRLKEKSQQEAADRQREQIAFAEDRVEIRRRELAEATARVQALEKLKEKRRQEHAASVEKADEKRRDDDAIQLWNNRPE